MRRVRCVVVYCGFLMCWVAAFNCGRWRPVCRPNQAVPLLNLVDVIWCKERVTE
ncbi:hypothetical protein EJ06DRAFT_533441 [Trichodelitschia bisporula]|uniref:Uncharacterized protein n=1 Tax=Trichodelitschia bisporula TaxID=703511 RepID=A0A6G1HMK7_9PEZI|nr:hypothetical protein EJ06DRAFT_533441 [Trichodelitschia bisporula]